MTYALLIRGLDAQGYVTASVFQEHEPERDGEGFLRDSRIWDESTAARIHLSKGASELDMQGSAAISTIRLMPYLGRISPHDRGSVKTPSITEEPLPSLLEGDIVVTDGVGRPDPVDPGTSHALILCGTPSVIGSVPGVAAIDEARRIILTHMDKVDDRRHMFRTSLSPEGFIAFEASAGRADREPNDVLVLTWKKEDGRLESAVIRSTGAFMFWENYANGPHDASSVGQPDGPGLWLMRDGKTWSSTDRESGHVDDWGLDGEFHAVTVAEAAAYFRTDPETILATMDELYPYEMGDQTILEAAKFPAGDPAEAVAAPSP